MNHPEHFCRFNDAPQTCECYDAGYNQALAEERSKAWEGEAVKQSYIQGKSHGISEAYERVRGNLPKESEESFKLGGSRDFSFYDEGFNEALSKIKSLLDNKE